MAALEDRIISKVLLDRCMPKALQAGLVADHFKDPERKQIWSYMVQHWFDSETSKTLPSVAAVKRRWPSFDLTAVVNDEEAELVSLIKEMKIMAFGSDVRSLANMFNELVSVSPEDAVATMQSGLTKVIMRFKGRGEHLGVSDIATKAAEHYRLAKEGKIFGLSWPWDVVTEDTMGKRPEDFIIIYGRMKSMKTWVMLFCAAHDYLVNNARVLIWSREMSQEAMAVRMASLLAKVDY